MITTNIKFSCINLANIKSYQQQVSSIHKKMNDRTSIGNEFLGWVSQPKNYYKSKEWNKMKVIAEQLNNDKVKILVVIGIGGSYLGSKAANDMIKGLYPLSSSGMEIVFLGNTMSSTYTKQVLEYVKDKEFAINVISKSGSTIEPAIAFRLLKDLLESSKGKAAASKRIIITTDVKKGLLKQIAEQEGYQTLIISDDIGGRFSVLTAVGIFPMLLSGINVDNVMIGALKAFEDLKDDNLESNAAYQYAVLRNIFYKEKKYPVEMLVSYELQLSSFAEWWKQLFGESEGKSNKGLLPCSVIFSTDLHSLGQFIQDGSKILFETILKIKTPNLNVKISSNKNDFDGLNYLSKYSGLHTINNLALEGTLKAHSKVAGIPNIVLELDSMNDVMFGYLVYFFFKACAMSAYLLEVNPFNQPGVEVYKKEMLNLLKK